MAKKKAKLADLLSSGKGLNAIRISGRNKQHKSELKPTIIAEITEGELTGERFEYMFLTPDAVKSLEATAFHDTDDDGNEIVICKVPTPDTSKDITWVTEIYE